jgi:GMP synthase (glutamine-hydrolysing)
MQSIVFSIFNLPLQLTEVNFMKPENDLIIILDFGSQTTQLIARRVRELGVYSEVLPCTTSHATLFNKKPKGIILSGGPNSVNCIHSGLTIPSAVFELHIPVLGICYGMQAMAKELGGAVSSGHSCEYGSATVHIQKESALLNNIPLPLSSLDVWMSHGDSVTQLPPGFDLIGLTKDCSTAIMEDSLRHYYGFQFHPELTHTPYGKELLSNFIHNICGCASQWNASHIIDSAIASIQKEVGTERVLLGLSGGVDSSVLAVLLHKAIGKNLIAVFVDNGLLRLNEVDNVKNIFSQILKEHLIVVDAKEKFYLALQGIEDPEEKRKTIGETFIRVFEEQAKVLNNVGYLAQGTIYPDVIESAQHEGSAAQVIKSHHNVGGLPFDMPFKLVEPLRMCFKDEVRKIGMELGLPFEVVYRHPFPGPGLGVRILGEIKREYIGLLQRADAIFLDVLKEANLYHTVSQAFAVFLPIKSVGVKGDQRSYDYVIALRSVDTIDFMSAHVSKIPFEILEKAALRIMNEIAGISRVVYDISSKPPSTIEWE